MAKCQLVFGCKYRDADADADAFTINKNKNIQTMVLDEKKIVTQS